jgi:hypothetical protein
MAPPAKQQKHVSGVNKRSNPDSGAGNKREWQHAQGRASKAARSVQTDKEKQQSAPNKSEREAQKEGAEFHDFLAKPRGRDIPGTFKKGDYKKFRPCIWVTTRLENDPEQKPEAEHVLVLMEEWQVRSVPYSNTPQFTMKKDGFEFRVRSENFKVEPESPDPIFFRQTYLNGDTEGEHVAKAFREDHHIPGARPLDTQYLLSFGKRKDSDINKGIELLTFTTQGSFWLEPQSGVTSTNPENRQNFELILNKLSERSHAFTIIRKAESVLTSLDKYWQKRVEVAASDGVWSWYNKQIGKDVGHLFEAWKQNPLKQLKHQPWMEVRDPTTNYKSIGKFASHQMKKSFGSMREFEIVYSVAVIMEAQNERTINSKYFDTGGPYPATLLQSYENGYIELSVEITKSEECVMPFINVGQTFEVRFIPLLQHPPTNGVQAIEDDKDEEPKQIMLHPQRDSKQASRGIGVDKPSKCNSPSIKAMLINLDSDGLILRMKVNSPDDKTLLAASSVSVELHIDADLVALRRRLKAIGTICKDVKKLDPPRRRFLQDFLMGKGCRSQEADKEHIIQEFETRMRKQADKIGTLEAQAEADKAIQVFQNYAKAIIMNQSQRAAWEKALGKREFLTLLQGPSRTGKTKTVASILLSFVLAKHKTALCAPSVVAVEAGLKHILGEIETLRSISPEAADNMRIIYLPANSLTKAGLTSMDDVDVIAVAHDIVAHEGSSRSGLLDKYKLHHYVLQSFNERAVLEEDDVNAGRQWLRSYERIKAGKDISTEALKDFIKKGVEEGTRVLGDPRTKIVASISGSADLMVGYGYRPSFVAVDDSASATPPDILLPLSLGARFNLLVGDDFQVRPVVRSKGYNEFAEQLGTSLFEQHFEDSRIPLTRLPLPSS